jgi:CDP-diacylglycerol---serine O-phosphatidyltransferase
MPRPTRLRRGIYLLPTLFTIGNLFCGFYGLVLTFRSEFEFASLLVIAAGILDGLDGRIARLTGTSSPFGNEFDSLADIVSFGVAPALLAYHWALIPLGRAGWLVAFLFVVCAAMRLARFNIQSSSSDKRYFAGLPSPMAGGSVACLSYALPALQPQRWVAVAIATLVTTLGLLMVSRFRYPSFKGLRLRSRRSYLYVLPIAATLVGIAVAPAPVMLGVAGLYLISAPAAYLWAALHPRSIPREHPSESVADEPLLR